MYLLKLLRQQGMPPSQLSAVAHSIIILSHAFYNYALPAWGGFLSADHINKTNALFQHVKCFGYITCNITATDLIEKSDLDLCNKVSYPGHSLHHLLPPRRVSHNLHERGHNYI